MPEFVLSQDIVKKIQDWHDFIRLQFVKEAAPNRAPGW
jgi:hypothetical protein